MYVHLVSTLRMLSKLGLSVVFLTPHLLGFNMNPNMEPVNIYSTVTVSYYPLTKAQVVPDLTLQISIISIISSIIYPMLVGLYPYP